MNFEKGTLIKLNPEMFVDKEPTDMVGDLGYVGVIQHCIWEVVRFVSDNSGNMYEVTLSNPDELLSHLEGAVRIEHGGTFFLLAKDVIQANSIITLDYQILNETAPSFSSEKVVQKLFKERNDMKAKGKSIASPELKENWRRIRVARGQLKATLPIDKDIIPPEVTTNVTVALPKQRMLLTVSRENLPKDSSEEEVKRFKQILVSILRKTRSQIKQASKDNIVNKEVYGTTLSLLGGVHTSPKQIENAQLTFMKDAFRLPKKPMDAKSNYVGIELEIIYAGNQAILEEKMAQRRLHRYVEIVNDPSVHACHNTGYKSCELKVLVRESELSSVLSRIAESLTEPDVDGYTNRSCGLHVHLDMRNRDHVLAFKNLVRVQDIMRGAQPRGRVTNLHCKPNKSDKFKPISDTGDRFDRYHVVNPNAYEKHTTIEIRVHEGTTDPSAIFNWTKFLITIADLKSEIPSGNYKLASDLLSIGVDIPSESVSYLDSRITKYKSLTA